MIQKNFLTFRFWAIVDIEIQTHNEKKIIVEKYFPPCFGHFKAQLAKIYFYARFNSFNLNNAFYERDSQFSNMKRMETSPEKAGVNIDYLSAQYKYQLIKNLMLNLKKITKNSMMYLSINFAKRSEE